MTSIRGALLGWCAAVALFGLLLAGAAFEATDGFARFVFGLLGHGDTAFTPPLRFAVALMGAVTLGWGLTLAAVASDKGADPAAAPALWRRITWAAVIWYVVDSTLSVATGFAFNAVSNTLLLVALLAILSRAGVFARR